MARIKNSGSTIKRRNVALATMFLSIALITLVLLYLLDYKSEGVGLFKTQLDRITEQFENAETQYNKMLTELTSTRTPVSEYNLTLLEEEYQVILSEIAVITGNENQEVPLQIANTIQERRNNLERLRIMNRTIQWEEIVGTQLTTYDTCVKDISYRSKSSAILTSLKACGPEIENALLTSQNLPQQSIAFCKVGETPEALIQKKLNTHNLFVNFYTLTSKNKAKEAAAVDVEYRKALKQLESSPDWNDCITVYLETEVEILSRQLN